MASDLPFPVDLLEKIFLYLDDAADLVRASAVCTSFRSVISDGLFLRRFLHRFRSVHRRPVLGLLIEERYQHCRTGLFCPAQPPRRSAQAAGGFAQAADFTFSFLADDRSHWRVCDARDGRVLLARCPCRNYMLKLEDLAVYDPLHRRHIKIRTIPNDMLLSAKQYVNNRALTLFENPMLTPSAVDDGMDGDEGFQVMCTGLSKTKVVAFVFSSGSGQWQCASFHNPSYDWTQNPSYDWTHLTLLRFWFRQQVHGHVCWACRSENVMLVFDTREMKFCITDLPHESIDMLKMVVEAGDGRLGLLLLSDDDGCTVMDLYSKEWLDIQESGEWRHKSSISLLPGFHWMLAGAAEGYALLRGIPLDQYQRCNQKKPKKRSDICMKKPEAHYFTLELKTLLVEKLCVSEYDDTQISFLYASFPPLFSPPGV